MKRAARTSEESHTADDAFLKKMQTAQQLAAQSNLLAAQLAAARGGPPAVAETGRRTARFANQTTRTLLEGSVSVRSRRYLHSRVPQDYGT